MTRLPQTLIDEAENKAAEWQLALASAEAGFPPSNWVPGHPCEFGVFGIKGGGYTVAPLFPSVLHDRTLRCLYRTDAQGS